MMNGGDLYELAKILGQRKHQDDRTLRQTGKESHRQNGEHGTRDVEADGRRPAEASFGSGLNVPVLFPRLKTDVSGDH